MEKQLHAETSRLLSSCRLLLGGKGGWGGEGVREYRIFLHFTKGPFSSEEQAWMCFSAEEQNAYLQDISEINSLPQVQSCTKCTRIVYYDDIGLLDE